MKQTLVLHVPTHLSITKFDLLIFFEEKQKRFGQSHLNLRILSFLFRDAL